MEIVVAASVVAVALTTYKASVYAAKPPKEPPTISFKENVLPIFKGAASSATRALILISRVSNHADKLSVLTCDAVCLDAISAQGSAALSGNTILLAEDDMLIACYWLGSLAGS